MTLRPHKQLGDAVCKGLRAGQYVFLGDTNHGAPAIRDAAFSTEVLRAIKDCGTRAAYVLEGPPGQEAALADDALALVQALGTADEQRILDRHRDRMPRLKGAMAMALLGVQSYHYDPGYARIRGGDDEAFRLLVKSYGSDNCSNIRLIYNVQAHAADPQAYWPKLEALFAERLAQDNRPVADAIRRDHPGGAAILYGNGHYTEADDMNEMVAADNHVWIDIKPDESDMTVPEGETDIEKLFKLPLKKDDRPDMVYFAAEQKLVDYAAIAATYGTVRKMSAAEFATCQANLPASLKTAFTGKAGDPDFTYADYRALMDEGTALPAIISHWARPAPVPAP
jgi:hypothetical protein